MGMARNTWLTQSGRVVNDDLGLNARGTLQADDPHVHERRTREALSQHVQETTQVLDLAGHGDGHAVGGELQSGDAYRAGPRTGERVGSQAAGLGGARHLCQQA